MAAGSVGSFAPPVHFALPLVKKLARLSEHRGGGHKGRTIVVLERDRVGGAAAIPLPQ